MDKKPEPFESISAFEETVRKKWRDPDAMTFVAYVCGLVLVAFGVVVLLVGLHALFINHPPGYPPILKAPTQTSLDKVVSEVGETVLRYLKVLGCLLVAGVCLSGGLLSVCSSLKVIYLREIRNALRNVKGDSE